MKIISLKRLLEQAGIDTKSDPFNEPTHIPGPDARKTPAEIVALQIYNARQKNFSPQDPAAAIKAIKNGIKDIHEYASVNKELQKLIRRNSALSLHTETGMGEFLRFKGFMDPMERLEVIKYLATVLPRNQWHWTILKIMPLADFKTLSNSKITPDLLDFYKTVR